MPRKSAKTQAFADGQGTEVCVQSSGLIDVTRLAFSELSRVQPAVKSVEHVELAVDHQHVRPALKLLFGSSAAAK